MITLKKDNKKQLDTEVFTSLQWSDDSQLFHKYRLAVTTYMVSMILRDFYCGYYSSVFHYTWFFTNWQILWITSYNLLSLSTYRAIQDNKPVSSRHLKWQMYLQSFGFNSSFTVMTFFWLLLAPRTDKPLWSLHNLHVHCFSFLLMLADAMVTKTPVLKEHFVYTVFGGMVYTVYTFLLYQFSVVTDVYFFLNWANPSTVFVGIGFSLFSGVAGHSLLYFLFKLRSVLHRKYAKKEALAKYELV